MKLIKLLEQDFDWRWRFLCYEVQLKRIVNCDQSVLKDEVCGYNFVLSELFLLIFYELNLLLLQGLCFFFCLYLFFVRINFFDPHSLFFFFGSFLSKNKDKIA